MQLPTVYEDSFLVSGIMCFGGCGYNIETSIRDYLERRFPKAKIFITSGPMPYGMHKYKVEIKSSQKLDVVDLTADIKKVVIDTDPTRFRVFDDNLQHEAPSKNWLNLLINIIAIASIIALSVVFPPSLFLSIGLGAICFSATLFTAREYILNFLKSLSSRNFLGMPVTVSFGLLLALIHAIYHVSFMPFMASFAMIFMNFIMPLILVSIVNVMDEIKRQIEKKSKKIFLNGIKSLFPEMQEEYLGAVLSENDKNNLKRSCEISTELLESCEYVSYTRHTICEGMLLKVKAGDCFPVDGQIVFGNTYVDKSILNGEPAIVAEVGTKVESGCLNLWHDVVILTENSEYYSEANRLLLQSTFQDKSTCSSSYLQPDNKFYYFYFGLFGVGIVISLVISCVLGTFTVGAMLQTMIGILFAVCPCTIGIAYYLPSLLKDYQLNKEEIIINNANLPSNIADFDVFIFDKTGTLTNESKVVDSVNITPDLWKKIYSIEKILGRKHPIALALQSHVEATQKNIGLENISEIHEVAANGICVSINDEKITVGNANYLKDKNIIVPQKHINGGACVYVAVDNEYIGDIAIKHVLRPGMRESLQKIKQNQSSELSIQPGSLDDLCLVQNKEQVVAKTLIMLTGDKASAADDLNEQCGDLFDKIYSEQTPYQKSDKIEAIVKEYQNKKICFIGDGLNDVICSNKLRELGGLSISVSTKVKAAFFTDMSLNGGLEYLFAQQEIDKQNKKIIKQNRWLMAYGALVFLTFLISFQVLGMGMSPLISMTVMFTTTLFVLFNSYRMQIVTHNLLDKKNSFIINKVTQSDVSIGLLIGGSLTLVAAILIASFSSLQLTLPLFVFSGGLINILSSSFLVAATVMLASFAVFICAYMLQNHTFNGFNKPLKDVDKDLDRTYDKPRGQSGFSI